MPDTGRWTVALAVFLSGCGTPPADEAPPPGATVVDAPAVAEAEPAPQGDGRTQREPVAPHGGVLAELGERYARIEVVVDPGSGEISLYVLDGNGDQPYRIDQPVVVAEVITDADPFTVQLAAVADARTGERSGNTSRFRGASTGLVGAADASIRVETITVRGHTFDNVRLRWVREVVE